MRQLRNEHAAHGHEGNPLLALHSARLLRLHPFCSGRGTGTGVPGTDVGAVNPFPCRCSGRTGYLETSLETVRKELAATQRQKSRLYELLELNEYDIPTFRERMEAVRTKQATLERKEADTLRILQDAKTADPAALAAKIKYVLDHYSTSDAAQKNALLHSVIQTVLYHKEKKTKPTTFYLDFVLVPN